VFLDRAGGGLRLIAETAKQMMFLFLTWYRTRVQHDDVPMITSTISNNYKILPTNSGIAQLPDIENFSFCKTKPK
jgi:hypothetical protein